MRRGIGLALACTVAMLAGAVPASAAPAITVIGNCEYAGGKFAASMSGFLPGQKLLVDVMATADPRAGAPLATHELTMNADGGLGTLLDVPPSDGTTRVARSLRVRGLAMQASLADAPLFTTSRGVSFAPGAKAARAATKQRWSVTGLPDGTRLWAHYRRAGRTVSTVKVGQAADPCGRLKFSLRTLPKNRERSGKWDLWLTSRRVFRAPRTGVYVHRRMTVKGRGSKARAMFGPLQSRLIASDPRAVAPETTLVRAYATELGVIRTLFLGDAGGAKVDFFERVDDRLKLLGSVRGKPGEVTTLDNATVWSCSRRTRRFVAITTLPDGSTGAGTDTIRTPSCSTRFRISAPSRVAPGKRFKVRVSDRWGNGAISPRLCVKAPSKRRSCRTLRFRRAVTIVSRRFRASKRGTFGIELRAGSRPVRVKVGIGRGAAKPKALPRVVVTGDSMMLGIDSFLTDELAGDADVRPDVRPGGGITRPNNDWTRIAAQQTTATRQRFTAILIGAADGFTMTTPAATKVDCCGEPWIAEYARRVRAMMRTYLRRGSAKVFWATLPLPKTQARQTISRAVNSAILRAAGGMAGVSVVRLDQLFTPTGYTASIRYRGRRVLVRAVDGVHLNVQGAAIAAKAFGKLIGDEL